MGLIVFLSKRSNGIYYLWFDADGGRRQRLSTGCKLKSDALEFLRDFKANEARKRVEIHRETLTAFFSEYLSHSRGIHTPKTQQSISTAFREFIRVIWDVRLDTVDVRQIETFLATKKSEASELTARKYYIHLASAWETTKRWNYAVDNPFRNIQKPKTREVQPLFFTKEEFERLIVTIQDEQCNPSLFKSSAGKAAFYREPDKYFGELIGGDIARINGRAEKDSLVEI